MNTMALMTGIERNAYHCKFIKQCRCWISEENGTIWAFIGPMLLIILVIQLTTKICAQIINIIIDKHFFLDRNLVSSI